MTRENQDDSNDKSQDTGFQIFDENEKITEEVGQLIYELSDRMVKKDWRTECFTPTVDKSDMRQIAALNLVEKIQEQQKQFSHLGALAKYVALRVHDRISDQARRSNAAMRKRSGIVVDETNQPNTKIVSPELKAQLREEIGEIEDIVFEAIESINELEYIKEGVHLYVFQNSDWAYVIQAMNESHEDNEEYTNAPPKLVGYKKGLRKIKKILEVTHPKMVEFL